MMACQYGYLFSYVPGDPGNPFVALWQATLLNAIVLGGVAVALLYAARLKQRTGARLLGFGYLALSALGGLLALIIGVTSTPLACGGVPGSQPFNGAEVRAYNTFLTLQTLATVALYLTILLVAAAIVALAFLAASRRRKPGAATSTIDGD